MILERPWRAGWHVWRLADDFSVRYGDLTNGSYDCLD